MNDTGKLDDSRSLSNIGKKSNIIWILGSILIFIFGVLLLYYISLSLNPKTLPLVVPLEYGNTTNLFICDRGISYRDTIVRGDTLSCLILASNKPETIYYKIDIYEVAPSIGGEIKILANYSVNPNIKIDKGVYYSEDIFLSVPESQSFGLIFQSEGTYMTSPIWVSTFSETDLNQRKINAYLILLPSIIALFGIFPAMKSIREMLNMEKK